MFFLRLLARYTTILMPVCSILGLLLPNWSNALLPWLDEILFFLMFFTLLGIEQRDLLKKIFVPSVWGFALVQNVILCLLLASVAYLLGIRGDLLLAITAFGATAPLFGSGAIVNAMGFDALLAMAKTIVATLVMPITLLGVLWLLAGEGAYIDIGEYFKRLIIYIICPIALSVFVRRVVPKKSLRTYYPKVAQFNVLLVLAFPFGLMGGFRQTLDTNLGLALQLLLIAVLMVLGIFVVTYLLYQNLNSGLHSEYEGNQRAIITATISAGRNVLLTYVIAMPFLGSMYLPLIGALQLPMFSVAFFAKMMVKNR